MKNILILFSGFFLSASSAFAAAPFEFTFFGNTSGRYTMVSCDYAESLVQDWMEKFGAKNVDVQCTGGIQPYGMFPIDLTVDYIAPDLNSGTIQAKKFTIESGPFPGESDCDFDTSLMRALLRDFPNVNATRQSDACFMADSRYTYDLTVTLPQKFVLTH